MVNPTDQELVAQKLSRIAYGDLIRRNQANQDRQFAAIPGGGFRLLLFNLPDFIHRSFTDQTLLATSTNHAVAVHNFALIETYTLSFLDKYLKGMPEPVLDSYQTVDPRANLEVFKAH